MFFILHHITFILHSSFFVLHFFMDPTLKKYHQYLKLEKGFSDNTVEAYERDVDKFLKFLEAEGVDPLEARIEHFHEFSTSLIDIGITPTSLARILAGVHSYYRFLVMGGDLETDPMELLEFPKKPQHLPDTLTVEEIDLIESQIDLSEPYGHRNLAIIETLFSCGLRVSELCELKMQDLYLEEEFIRVNGKGSKQRLVPISQRAIKLLKYYFPNEKFFLDPKVWVIHRDGIFMNDALEMPVCRKKSDGKVWQLNFTKAMLRKLKNYDVQTYGEWAAAYGKEHNINMRFKRISGTLKYTKELVIDSSGVRERTAHESFWGMNGGNTRSVERSMHVIQETYQYRNNMKGYTITFFGEIPDLKEVKKRVWREWVESDRAIGAEEGTLRFEITED